MDPQCTKFVLGSLERDIPHKQRRTGLWWWKGGFDRFLIVVIVLVLAPTLVASAFTPVVYSELILGTAALRVALATVIIFLVFLVAFAFA